MPDCFVLFIHFVAFLVYCSLPCFCMSCILSVFGAFLFLLSPILQSVIFMLVCVCSFLAHFTVGLRLARFQCLWAAPNQCIITFHTNVMYLVLILNGAF